MYIENGELKETKAIVGNWGNILFSEFDQYISLVVEEGAPKPPGTNGYLNGIPIINENSVNLL